MFCPYCGTEKKIEAARFCAKCGKPYPNTGALQQSTPQPQQVPQPFDGVYDTNLPSGVYYGPYGHLNWLYKSVIKEKEYGAPVGTEYIIRYEFDEEKIIRYRKQFLNLPEKKESKAAKVALGTLDVMSDLAILFSDNDSVVDAAIRYDDLREEPSETVGDYYYKKIKIIEPRPEDNRISIKHGWDKFSIYVMPEQFDYILSQIEKRCPAAVRGEVYKKK